MVRDIDRLVRTSFCAEMEMNLIPGSPRYSQYEAERMAKLLAQVYAVAHCIACKACGSKYRYPQPTVLTM